MDQLTELLKTEAIDVLLLQEVRDEALVMRVREACDFDHYYWKEYFDCKEGLAILSRHPISAPWTNWDDNEDVHNSGSMCVNVLYKDLSVSIMNVHLDYKLAANREVELLKALTYLEKQDADYRVIAGDFNTYPASKLYGFVTGLMSLNGESKRYIDLPEAYSIRNNTELDVTIDFINNPRWANDPCLEKPGRFDWVMLENPYPRQYPKVADYALLGKEVISGVTPSDHYGVVIELAF